MEEKADKAREKLCSFNIDKLKSMNIAECQKEAIEKMMFLSQEQFDDLVEDVCNEIDMRRRNETTYTPNPSFSEKRNMSCRKLRCLNNEKFSNLVVDVLLVLNHRIPSAEHAGETCDMLSDLENILLSLKRGRTSEERTIREIKLAGDFQQKTKIFMKYLKSEFKNNRMETGVMDVMEAEMRSYFRGQTEAQMGYMLKTENFLEYADRLSEDVSAPEYAYRRKNIKELVDTRPEGYRRLVKAEMCRIFELLLEKHDAVETENPSAAMHEVTVELINALESFVRALKLDTNGSKVGEEGIRMLGASSSFYNKLRSTNIEVDDDMYKAYESQQQNIESSLSNRSTEHGLFNAVIEFTYFLKEFLTILKIDT